LGQFSKTYIIAENDEGLIFFEQRMLLEKLIYEFYLMLLQKKDEMMISTLDSPILIELSSKEAEFLNLNIEDMSRAGFSISHFGKNTFTVYSIPEILIEEKVEKIIIKFINRFSTKKIDRGKMLKEICYTAASYGELNSLKKLNQIDMEFLLAKWEELGNPLNSIQNKSMLLKISKQGLENLFKS